MNILVSACFVSKTENIIFATFLKHNNLENCQFSQFREPQKTTNFQNVGKNYRFSIFSILTTCICRNLPRKIPQFSV